VKRRNRQRLRPLPLREYLAFNALILVVIEIVQAAVIAGLAASRASGHRLTATQTAIFLVAGAIVAVGVGSLISFYSGLTEAAAGLVLAGDKQPNSPAGDPFAPRAMWGRIGLAALVAAVWGTGLGLLVVAVLDGRQAGYPILFVGFVAAAGGASIVRGLIGRAAGAGVALNPPPTLTPRSARKRAWLELALPLALLVAAVNGSFTWVLFHDYVVGAQFGARVLTEQQVLADVMTLVVVNTLIVAFICGRAGRAEAAMKLVAFENPAEQIPDGKTGFGLQIFVYTAFAALLVTSLVRFLLPPLPTLWEAIAARAFLAGGTAFLVAGFAYVRGAANMTSGAAKLVSRYDPERSVTA
jgi:hypothetical protein